VFLFEGSFELLFGLLEDYLDGLADGLTELVELLVYVVPQFQRELLLGFFENGLLLLEGEREVGELLVGELLRGAFGAAAVAAGRRVDALLRKILLLFLL
jgi:hypothetical protein